MSIRRISTTLFVTLLTATTASAQEHLLKEDAAGTCCRVELTMSLAGQLKLQQEGKIVELKQTAEARHEYVDRILEADLGGTSAKSARFYRAARVAIEVAGDRMESSLRPERALMIVQRGQDQSLTYSPKGALTRAELQLTDHLDTLVISGLLPDREVTLNDSWKLENSVVEALCHFEGLSSQELSGKLTAIHDHVATFTVAGSATGIDLGAAVTVSVHATGRFDLKERRLIGLVWKQNDEREQGPVSPASSVAIAYTLTRAAIDTPPEVNDDALVPVLADAVPETLTLLTYQDPRDRYQLQHTRDWHLVGRTDEHSVLRLMDRGEFIAQVTLTPWKKRNAGDRLGGDEFKELIVGTPGWAQDRVIDADEVKEAAGENWIYRVAAEGRLDGTPALQHFYYVSSPQGDQLLVAFTMTPTQAQKLGTRDFALVRQIVFPAPAAVGEAKK